MDLEFLTNEQDYLAQMRQKELMHGVVLEEICRGSFNKNVCVLGFQSYLGLGRSIGPGSDNAGCGGFWNRVVIFVFVSY